MEEIDIPGGDGVLDLTEAFGETKYKNRKISFEFSTIAPKHEFMDVFSRVQNLLHGRRMDIRLSDDPGWYYTGRVSVNEWKADKAVGRFTVDCDCEPYKYKAQETTLLQRFSGKNLFNCAAPQLATAYNTSVTSLSTGIRITSLSPGQWRFAQFKIAPIKMLAGLTITLSYKATVSEGAAERAGIGFFKNPYYPIEIAAYASNGRATLSIDAKRAETFDTVGLWLYSSRNADGTPGAYVDYTDVQIEIGTTATAFEAYDSTTKNAVITATNSRKTVIPLIMATAPATVEKGGFTASIQADAENRIPELEMKEGNHVFTVSGSGLFAIQYREGSL